MSSNLNLDKLSRDELVARFKAATMTGDPPQDLVEAMARRPGIAFIEASDSTGVTIQKAMAAIAQVEQSNR